MHVTNVLNCSNWNAVNFGATKFQVDVFSGANFLSGLDLFVNAVTVSDHFVNNRFVSQSNTVSKTLS